MCLVTGDKHNETEEKATEDIKVRILKYYVHIAIYINKLKGKTGPGSSWALIWSIYTRVSPKYTFFIILTNIQNVALCIPYKITGKRIGILNGLGHECAKVLIIQRKSQIIQRKICQQIVLALISHRMVQSM